MSYLQLFYDFLKKNKIVIGFYIIVLLIFSAVFYVCSLPLYAVSYGFLLSGMFVVILGGFCFIRYAQRCRNLRRQDGKILYELDGLPEALDEQEKAYQDLITALFNEKSQSQSQAMTERKELNDYYTMWLHQIKTPIAAMRLLLQSTEENTAELKVELFKIEQYAGMALQYLRINDMSKDMILAWHPLEEIVKCAVRKYSTMFILKKITLELREIHANVLTDEKWLEFVIEQLLSNALKYTREGKICIRYDEKNGILLIEDTGIGISPEDLPRVFERGFTGYNGRTDKKATGIGLYLCKQILDKLCHEIMITSKVSEGTMVYLFLKRDEFAVE